MWHICVLRHVALNELANICSHAALCDVQELLNVKSSPQPNFENDITGGSTVRLGGLGDRELDTALFQDTGKTLNSFTLHNVTYEIF